MNFRKLTILIASAITGLTLMVGAAMATEAKATTALNVRAGAGSHHHVVDVLHRGERVHVEQCRRNGWCYINHHGRNGWVSSRYLTEVGYQRKTRVHSRRHAPQYYDNIEEFHLRFGGGNFSFSIKGGNAPDCIRRNGRVYCR